MLGTSNTSTNWGKGNTTPNLKRTSNIKNKFVAVLLTLVTIIAFSAFEISQFSSANAHTPHPDTTSKPIVWMRGGIFGNNKPNYKQNEQNGRIYIGFQRSHFVNNERDGPAVNIKYKITDTSNFIKDRSIVGVPRTFSFAHNANTSWKGPSYEIQDDLIDEIIIDVEDYDDMGNLKAMAARTGYAEGEVSSRLPRPIKIEILEDDAYHIVGSAGAMAADSHFGSVNCDYDDNKVPGIHSTQFHDAPGGHARCAAIYYKFEDDDKPSAKIVANPSSGTSGLVLEDSAWQFKVELNILPARNISIPLTVTPITPNSAGTFFENIPTSVSFGPGMHCSDTPPCEVEFDIIAANGVLNNFGQDAQFSVAFGTIPTADDFKYGWHNNNNNLQTITLIDDGLSTLEISSDNTELTEADDIVVKFTVAQGSVVPTSEITVSYTVNQNNLDFIDPNHVAQAVIPANGFTNRVRSHTIDVIDDLIDERDSRDNDFNQDGSTTTTTIDITLTPGSQYKIDGSTDDNTVRFIILDDENTFVAGVSLEDRSTDPPTPLGNQNEGSGTNFYIHVTPAPWRPIEVTFTADDGVGDCLDTGGISTIHNTSQIPVKVVEDDLIDEKSCDVVITLVASTDGKYNIHPTENMVQFTVEDNDISLVSFGEMDDGSTVSENSDSQFTLKIPNPAPQAITISFNATDTGNFLDETVITNGTGTAMIPEGQTDIGVGILFNDDDFETQATVTVSLIDDSSTPKLYYIDPVPEKNSITLTATSDDGITVSISTTGENDSEVQERTITEGEDVSANVILRANIGNFNQAQTFTFNYSVTDMREFRAR